MGLAPLTPIRLNPDIRRFFGFILLGGMAGFSLTGKEIELVCKSKLTVISSSSSSSDSLSESDSFALRLVPLLRVTTLEDIKASLMAF